MEKYNTPTNWAKPSDSYPSFKPQVWDKQIHVGTKNNLNVYIKNKFSQIK